MPDLHLPTLTGRSDPLADDLRSVVRGDVRFGVHDRLLYATDASFYQVEPIGVVVPRDAADAQRALQVCAAHGAAVLPRGGGTSLAGQTVNRAVVIDFGQYCRRIGELDREGRTVVVGPGVVLDQLNRHLAPAGLMFAPDVATSGHACVGGMIGNNSAGAHSVMYGRTVEHVRRLDVALADGTRVSLSAGASGRDARVVAITERIADVVRPLAETIDARFPKTQRRVNGYNLDLFLEQLRRSTPGTTDAVNLAALVTGSEGTLALTLEAELDLVPTPAVKGLAIVGFAGVDEALASVEALLETGPAAIELIDDVILNLAEKNIDHRRSVDLMPRVDGRRPGAVLYVERFESDPAALEASFARLRDMFGSACVHTYDAPDTMLGAWQLRKAGEPLLHGQPGRRKPQTFIEDTVVAPKHLPEFVKAFRAMLERHGTTASYYAHASVGCLHIRPMICLADPDDVATMQAIMVEATDLVMSFGGALSGEHGDGRLRSHLLERFYGPEIMDAFRRVKAIFDPDGRLNPGNIVDGPPMAEHMRVHPEDQDRPVPDVDTYYRYEREHGFGGAVEMCNGAGVCRRMTVGTMCPSYRATLDERHATRGRGNALRLAITGQFGSNGAAPAWNDPDTQETLGLCLSCKACKRECPSNVDVSKLKAEYTAQGYRAAGGAPLALRAMGAVRDLNRLAALTPRLSNRVARSRLGKWAAARFLGIDFRRDLPLVAPSLLRWARGHRSAVPAGAPRVTLFADCFTTWNEPQIGRAAVRALEACGYRVHIADAGCCGRARLSQGLLEDAQATIPRTAARLARAAEGSEAIVFCEPSCWSAVTDDWPELRLDIDRAVIDGLHARARLVEDFLAERWGDHPRTPALRSLPASAVRVHGHCHQKALGELGPTLELLRRIPDADVEAIPSGCCGMAGAFGYGNGRYDLSMQIGELSLFPAVRAAPDALVAAPGTSCRHQIHDGTERRAQHPVELFAQALAPE